MSSLESVFKNLHFVVENAVYVWIGRANRAKNLRFRKYPDTCGRDLRCETAIGIVLCYSRQACCLLCCLCHINNGSYTYQFTFDLCSSVSGCRCGFRFEQKYLRIDGFGHKNYPLPSALDYVYIREDTIYHLLV